ncbi:MAG: 50S ribosomal protein L15 [Alphaproteobacteria bacterium]
MLNDIRDNNGARKSRKRKGRGESSGIGKTAGRGVKGQKSRSGVAIKGFEGGQMPLYQRMPKRGFNNPFASKFAELNVGKLQDFITRGKLNASDTITEAMLLEAGVVRRLLDGVRLLGKGEITDKVTIEVTGTSKGAVAAIEKAGGSVTILAKAKTGDAA